MVYSEPGGRRGWKAERPEILQEVEAGAERSCESGVKKAFLRILHEPQVFKKHKRLPEPWEALNPVRNAGRARGQRRPVSCPGEAKEQSAAG